MTPEEQQRYKPKHLRSKDETSTKSNLDKYDRKNKLLMDFYVSMPEEYESIEDFLKNVPLVIGTTDSADVLSMFPVESRILKFKGVPIEAVKRYFTLKTYNSNSDESEFKDFKMNDEEKKYNFIKFNNYRIFEITPADYIDKITVTDDTPDEDGFVDRRKDDDMGVLESLDLIIRAANKVELIKKIDRLKKVGI
jgi:hypothetical protein